MRDDAFAAGEQEIVALVKSGASARQIIEELRRTNTVLMLHGSDFARLGQGPCRFGPRGAIFC